MNKVVLITGTTSGIGRKTDAKKLAELVVFLAETEGLSPDEILINRLSK